MIFAAYLIAYTMIIVPVYIIINELIERYEVMR